MSHARTDGRTPIPTRVEQALQGMDSVRANRVLTYLRGEAVRPAKTQDYVYVLRKSRGDLVLRSTSNLGITQYRWHPKSRRFEKTGYSPLRETQGHDPVFTETLTASELREWLSYSPEVLPGCEWEVDLAELYGELEAKGVL